MSTIEEVTAKCVISINDLAATLPAIPAEYRAEMSVEKLIDERDRFRIWAGWFNDFQLENESLSSHLKEFPTLESNISKLLGRLVEILSECIDITTGVRAPLGSITDSDLLENYDYSEGSEPDDEIPETELGQHMNSITSVISDLFKLSVKIRRGLPLPHKPTLYDESIQIDDHTWENTFASHEQQDRNRARDLLFDLRKHLTIGTDQLALETTSQGRPDPKDDLTERLITTMTKRQRALRYRQKHAADLAHMSRNKYTKEDSQLEKGSIQHWSNPGSVSDLPTKFYGIETESYKPTSDNTPDTVSNMLFASNTSDMEGNTINTPPAPASALHNPHFLCPYCGLWISSIQGVGRAWKNHVLHDLLPYVCTYPNCPDGIRLYRSREAWHKHERMTHRRVWRCFYHPNMTFRLSSELREHLDVEHGSSVAITQVQTLIDLSASTAEDTRTECPICLIQGPFPDGITNHVASHLEKLATFAIRENFSGLNTELDEELDSSSVTENYEPSVEMQFEQPKNNDALEPFQPKITSSKIDGNPIEGFNMPSPLSNAIVMEYQLHNLSSNINEITWNLKYPTQYDDFGRSIPSTDPGANIHAGGGMSGSHWYCNGQQIRQIPGLPSGFSKYSTHSMYFSAGVGFWVLRGDSTTGTEFESWRPLRFDHDDNNFSSFVTSAGKNPQLRVQRPDQKWPAMLLPDIYHAYDRTEDLKYGGLIGELGVFLALIALSMPQESMLQTLPTMYDGGRWKVHGYRFPRTDRRGVVVEVWSSDFSTLERMENGDFGTYYN